METLESLTARLETTGEIGDIVSVMKSLSSVSIRQYDQAARALKTYQRTVELGLRAVLRGAARTSAEMAGDGEKARALIFIGSDRGLCGNFNEIIARFARQRYLAQPDGPGQVSHLLVVGQRGAQHLDARGYRPGQIVDLPGTVGGLVSVARQILVLLDGWRQETGGIEVDICHNRRTESSTSAPDGQRLLPAPRRELNALAAASWTSRGLPFYRMPPRALLPALLREQVFVKIYRALVESLASEHAHRLAALQAAERNIEDVLDSLHARHRAKRQEEITTELLDIVSGYESMREDGEHRDAEGYERPQRRCQPVGRVRRRAGEAAQRRIQLVDRDV